MSTTRKSPTESATLYKVGPKKIGNDGNKWIIVENKNNVKKWQLYNRRIKESFKKEEKNPSVKPIKKRVSKKISLKNVKTTDLYDLPKIKKNNWNKWLENLTSDQKKYVDKVRNAYKSIEKETDIIVIEVILPVSNGGYYFIDYIWDYAKELHPSIYDDDKAYLMVTFKLTQDMHLFLDSKIKAFDFMYYYKNIENRSKLLDLKIDLLNKLNENEWEETVIINEKSHNIKVLANDFQIIMYLAEETHVLFELFNLKISNQSFQF